MKRLLASLICTIGLSIAQAGSLQISIEDILLLAEQGVSDETILVFVKTREIGFIPDAEDIDKLHAASISEEVIRYILRQTATDSSPSYRYQTRSYVDYYPLYYYTPYYYGSSVFLGYSGYPHTWFGNYYGGVHYTPLHYKYNDHGVLSHGGGHRTVHANRHGLGHNGLSVRRHGNRQHTVRQHTVRHGGLHNVGHSSRNTNHRGGGYSRRHGGGGIHGGGRGHSGGHSGGGHGGGH
jgi:uncharacterized membrane protein YgcG